MKKENLKLNILFPGINSSTFGALVLFAGTHTHTRTLSHTHTQSRLLALSLTRTHMHTLALSSKLSRQLCRRCSSRRRRTARRNTHSLTLSHTLSLTLVRWLSLLHARILSCSLPQAVQARPLPLSPAGGAWCIVYSAWCMVWTVHHHAPCTKHHLPQAVQALQVHIYEPHELMVHS